MEMTLRSHELSPLSDSVSRIISARVKEFHQFIDEINSQSIYYRQQTGSDVQSLIRMIRKAHFWLPPCEDVQLVASPPACLFSAKGDKCFYYGTELVLEARPRLPSCQRLGNVFPIRNVRC